MAWSLIGASALVGGVVGWLVRVLVRRGGHRRDTERGRPVPFAGWPVPAAAIVFPLVVAGVGLRGASATADAAPGTPIAAAAERSGHPLVVLVYLLAATALLALAAIDLDVHRLPNAWTLPAYPVVAVALALCSWVTGDVAAAGRAILAALLLGGTYLLLHRLSSHRTRGAPGLGLGDVKLAAPLGALLGWLGWTPLWVGAYAGFLIGGLAGVALLLARRAGRHTALAHGPAMALGALAGVAGDPTIATLAAYVTGGE